MEEEKQEGCFPGREQPRWRVDTGGREGDVDPGDGSRLDFSEDEWRVPPARHGILVRKL